jgi:3-phosphoshikimate 1-carboxyvinyltransferase
MQAVITPSIVSGTVTPPASKSAMQRACAAALIRTGATTLYNPGISADDIAALNIIEQLGASIKYNKDSVLIESSGVRPVSGAIDCGESGLSVRMFSSIASLWNGEINIRGTGSLLKRPLNFFVETLPLLNVDCKSNNGFLPMSVQGPLIPKDITIDGSLSSQYLTGLLFAYSAAEAKGKTITVNNLSSKPYIDLTLDVLKKLGLKVPHNDNYSRFYYDETNAALSKSRIIDFVVEADWSGAAFHLVAGAIAGSISVKGLDLTSTQADKAILQALMNAGAVIDIKNIGIEVRQSNLNAFHFDATDSPDLFPPLVALAAFCDGESSIRGVHRLTHKESNRSIALRQEFGKMGIEIQVHNDVMKIKGVKKLMGVHVESHHDHRIAMACATAGLRATGNTTVNNAEAVNKSYPQFWQHLHQLGASVSLMHN